LWLSAQNFREVIVSFETILAAQLPTRAGTYCQIHLWRDTLSDEDRAGFDSAMKVTTTTSANIHRAMKIMNFEGRVETLQRHRRQECTCVVL
jgi:hypothetical protein